MSIAPDQRSVFPFLPPENLRTVAVICHRHADADTYLSAYALRNLIKRISPGSRVDLILPDGMSTLTQKLAQLFPFQPPATTGENADEGQHSERHQNEDVGEKGENDSAAKEEYDLLIVVDTGHPELLKDWQARLRASRGLRVLIDHHPVQENALLYDRLLVDTTASSAAEVVFSVFKTLELKPDAEVSQALLIAILFDSQHLAIAGEKTLRAVVELIDFGANFMVAKSSLRSPPDYGEVVAKLKAARRLKLYRMAGWVVVTSTVGSFQANVARSFISLGADVAIVAGEAGGETRGSLRANQRFRDTTNVHLGTDLAEPISKGVGYGGGHPTAASFTCDLPADEVVEVALTALSALLKEKPSEIK